MEMQSVVSNYMREDERTKESNRAKPKARHLKWLAYLRQHCFCRMFLCNVVVVNHVIDSNIYISTINVSECVIGLDIL